MLFVLIALLPVLLVLPLVQIVHYVHHLIICGVINVLAYVQQKPTQIQQQELVKNVNTLV